ncbi:hypothetical protein U8V72_11655 [Priestia filamentosa]|uniref:hypothetical protein n=1 Tax=Priestia filamentosa TaxID=1402861 RepID=UPI00397BDC1C
MSTNTEKQLNTAKLKHPKLRRALETYMCIVGTKNSFDFSEELEKNIKRMKIQFNDGDICATDFSTIFIGLLFPYYTDNLDENYNITKGIIGHEVGHIRFTSKRDWDMFINTSRGKYKKLAAYARDVLNIVEDDRIEFWMGQVSKFLKNAFYLLCQRMANSIQEEFDEIDFSQELSAEHKLAILRNAILYIRCTQSSLLPNIQSSEIMGYLKKIYPYMVYCRTSKSTKRAVQVAHKIMGILSPLCEEFNEAEEARMEGMYPDNSKGSNNPSENNSLVNSSNDDTLSKELKSLKEKIAKEVAKELGDKKPQGDSSNVANSGSDSDPSDQTNTKSIPDYVEDITERLLKERTSIKEKSEKRLEELKEESRKPITSSLIGEFMNSTNKSTKQKVAETLEDKKIVELKPEMVNKDIHDLCVPVFVERDEMTPFIDYEYSAYTEQFSTQIKRGANELSKLTEQKKQVLQRMQKFGRLDSRRLVKAAAFGAKDIFYKKKMESDQFDMDVLIFVDRSGSNMHQVLNTKNDTYLPRYEVNRMTAIIQHEILKRAKISHAVWSFEEMGVNNIFAPMIHFNNCFEKDSGLYLNHIEAKGRNRDGYSIAYAGEYLLKHGNNRKKLLIVISDGQPNGHHGYTGSLAMNDVKNTVTKLRKQGVKTIGIFTGDEIENQFFTHMYDNHMFLNNDNIHNLPEELRKQITLEFKEYLNSF